jgi:hypothetical protein
VQRSQHPNYCAFGILELRALPWVITRLGRGLKLKLAAFATQLCQNLDITFQVKKVY